MKEVISGLTPQLQQAVESAVEGLMLNLKDLSAALVASTDGFEIAARAQSSVDVSKLAAMACSISALGSMVGEESAIGQYQNVVVEADEGYVVILDIPHPSFPMILSLVASRDEILGQVLYRAKRVVSRLVTVV